MLAAVVISDITAIDPNLIKVKLFHNKNNIYLQLQTDKLITAFINCCVLVEKKVLKHRVGAGGRAGDGESENSRKM